MADGMANHFVTAQRDFGTAKTWVTRNPEYRFEVLTDSNALGYVEEKYGPNGFDRLDIVDMFCTVNVTIIKADLLRYLVMYGERGIYADIDVEDLRPIHRFIPERYDESEIDMVISVEIDQPGFKDPPILSKKTQSFCQWTFMAKPKQAVMMRVVENIMNWLNDVAYEQNIPVGQIELTFDKVLTGTGPPAFTSAVLQEINERSHGSKLTWADFHDLDESKIPRCFGEASLSRVQLAKQAHEILSPGVREVERCNWNPDCVRTWDDNLAAFAKMSPEQQQQKLAEPKPEPMGPGFNGFAIQVAHPAPHQQPAVVQPEGGQPRQLPPLAK